MNPDQMNMAIPHSWHQDLDVRLGQFRVMRQDIFRGANGGDFGVFDDDDTSLDEEGFTPTGSRATIWRRYLAMHMRKQLSFGELLATRFYECAEKLTARDRVDMWWLGLGLFLVCIIEVCVCRWIR